MSHICTPKNMMISRSIPRYLTTSTSPDSCWNAATLLSFADEKLESNVLPFLLQRKGEVFMGLKAPQKKETHTRIFFPAIEESQPKISKKSWISQGLWKHRISRNLVKTFRRFTFGSDQQCFWMHFVAQNERLGLVGRSLGGKFRWFFFRTKKKGVAKERRGKFQQKKKWLVTSAHGIHVLLKDLRGDVSEWSMFFVTSPKQLLVFLLVFANHLHSIFRGKKLLIFVPEAWKGKHVLPQSAGGLSMTRNCLRAEGGITRKYTIYALNLKPTNHFPSNQPDVRSNSSAPSLFDVLNELQRCWVQLRGNCFTCFTFAT